MEKLKKTANFKKLHEVSKKHWTYWLVCTRQIDQKIKYLRMYGTLGERESTIYRKTESENHKHTMASPVEVTERILRQPGKI